jgi:hypothetical protein
VFAYRRLRRKAAAAGVPFRVRHCRMTASDEQWARPSSVPLPTIWKKYRGLKQMANGKVPTFVIQDVPEDMHDDVLQFMTTHFCRDEVLCESVRILDDPVSVLELQDFWRKLLKQNMGIVALVDDDEDGHRPRIAGCNVTGVTSKDEKIQLDMVKISITYTGSVMQKITRRGPIQ